MRYSFLTAEYYTPQNTRAMPRCSRPNIATPSDSAKDWCAANILALGNTTMYKDTSSFPEMLVFLLACILSVVCHCNSVEHDSHVLATSLQHTAHSPRLPLSCAITHEQQMARAVVPELPVDSASCHLEQDSRYGAWLPVLCIDRSRC